MPSAKQFAVRTITGLFTISLFGLAISTAVNGVFGTPDTLKSALIENKLYEAAAETIVTNAIEDAGKKSDIPLQNKTVQEATRAAITPELIQANGEKVIDGTYAWLEGETKTPEFKLDTKDIQNQVAANVAGAGKARVEKLPVCTATQLQQINPQQIDPFTIPCRPPGVDLAALQKRYQREIASSKDVVKDSSVTADDIENANGQNVFAQAERVTDVYQLGRKLPFLFGLLVIICGPAIVFLCQTKRHGIKIISRTLLSTGLLLLVSILIVTWLLGRANLIDETDSPAMQNAILAVVKSLNASLNRILGVFTGMYVAFGIGGLMWSRLLNNQAKITEHPLDKPDDIPSDELLGSKKDLDTK